MTTILLELPDSLVADVADLAEVERVTLEEFIASVLEDAVEAAEKEAAEAEE